MTGPGLYPPPANQACSGGSGGFPPGSRRRMDVGSLCAGEQAACRRILLCVCVCAWLVCSLDRSLSRPALPLSRPAAGLSCGRPPSAAASGPSHLPPGDIRSFFCASDHQFSRHRRQRRRTRRCESDSPLVADATSTSPPARSSPQLLPPATGPSSLSTATTSLYDANAQIAPPSIREPSNGSDIHNSEHEGRGGPNPLTNQRREGRGRGAGLEREPD